MKYDAFISYRHGGLDGLVAEKLHKMLETYRIPSAIAKKTGKKRIKRVFRDREELPTSSNLSGSIEEALENSEFLLLICSPRLLESKWCMREVELFSEMHGKDRIITLLIDGEPDEAFPPDIRFREVNGEIIEVEPLAADIRGATHRESIKLLKNEKLRLMAPLLGCAYDDLRQRHRARRRRITMGISGAVLAGSLSFGSFSTYQYIQIQRQMQLKLENQSYVLSEYSDEALADGYPEIAALLALEALPKSLDNPERPYVRAAEMALANALGVYDISDGFKPNKTVTLPAAPGGIELSPEGSYAAVVYNFELLVIDPKTGAILETLQTAESSLVSVKFLNDSVVVFAGEAGLTAYDIAASTVLWTGEAATGVDISDDGTVVAAVCRDEGRALLYAPDGSRIGVISFGGRSCPVPVNDTFLNPRDFVFALSGDGSLLAVSFSDGSLSIFETGSGAGETVIYASSAAIHFAGGFSGRYFAFAVVENEPYAAHYKVYDTQSSIYTLEISSQNSRFVAFADMEGLYFSNENQIYTVTGASGELQNIASIGERIENLQKCGNTFMVCDNAGGYHFISGGVTSFTSDYVCDFAVIGEKFALTGSYDSDIVRILEKRVSAAKTVFAYDPAYSFSEAKAGEDGKVLLYSYTGFRLCAPDGTVIEEKTFEKPELVIDTQYDRTGGNFIVLYEDRLLIFSGKDGSMMLDKSGSAGIRSVIYSSYGVHVFEVGGTVSLINPSTAEVLAQENVPADADFAVLAGKPLYSVGGVLCHGGAEAGKGSFIGGSYDDGIYRFAVADNESGCVYTVDTSGLREEFTFNVRGNAEAYFTGSFVFVSELRGTATAYRMDGTVAREFSIEGYIAETEVFGDLILAHFISASAGRYSLLLDGDTLDAGAYLPGLLDRRGGDTLIFDNGNGQLRECRVLNADELVKAAQSALNGRTLTDSERIKYRAQ